MPYNVLAGMAESGMLKSPVQSFMEGRQQQLQNALASRQQALQENELAYNRSRLDAAAAEQQRQAAAVSVKERKANLGAMLDNLESIAQDPQRYGYVYQQLASHPGVQQEAQKDGFDITELADPRNITAVRAKIGLAPPAPKSNDPGELVQIVGPNGQPTLVPRAQAVNQRPYIKPDKPEKASEPASAQLVTRPNPDGTVQDFAFDPKTRELSPVGSPYKKGSDVTPKDINTARQKMVQLAVARKQIEDIKERFKESVGVSQGAFGQGILPTVSGKKFDAAVDAIRSTFSGLTRVPGIGAMSDWEGKLAQQPLPNRNDYEAVTAQKIQQIDDLVSRLEAEYGKVLKEDSQPSEGGPNGLGVGQTATIGGAKVTRVK